MHECCHTIGIGDRPAVGEGLVGGLDRAQVVEAIHHQAVRLMRVVAEVNARHRIARSMSRSTELTIIGAKAPEVGRGRAARRRGDLVGSVADAVPRVKPEDRLHRTSWRPMGRWHVSQAVRRRVPEALGVGRADVVPDVGQVEVVGARVGPVDDVRAPS